MFEFGHWSTPSNEGALSQSAACIRCREAPRLDAIGYCVRCHWFVLAELEDGFQGLKDYLTAWARFSDWCAERGQRIA